MSLRIVGLIGSIFLVTACDTGDKSGKGVLSKGTLKKDSIGVVSPVVSVSVCDHHPITAAIYSFRNDEFISDVLGKELTRKNIDSVFSGMNKESKLSKNKYTPGQFDTTTIYKVDCDSVVYIASKANSFPLYVSVQSGRITLDNDSVKVGMPKEKFVEKFHLGKDVPDVVKIIESEGANEVVFIFGMNGLVRIIYNNLYVE